MEKLTKDHLELLARYVDLSKCKLHDIGKFHRNETLKEETRTVCIFLENQTPPKKYIGIIRIQCNGQKGLQLLQERCEKL